MLSVNYFYFNVEKSGLIIFKSTRKVICDDVKINLSGKRLYPSYSVKPTGVRTDGFLRRHDQVNGTAVDFSKANALLLKIRNYVNMKT